MRRVSWFVLAFVLSFAAFGQCTTQLAFSAISAGTPITDRPWGVTFTNCPTVTATTFTAGSSGSLTLGGIRYDAVIDSFIPPTPISPNPQVTFTLKIAQGSNDPVNVFYATNTAVFQYPVNGQMQSWNLTLTEALNLLTHSFHVGRADANEQNQPAIPPAYELQLTSSYSYRPPFVATGTSAPLVSRIQRDFALKIDTTDKKTGYVDDNSVSAGAFFPRINLAGLIAQGKIGGEVDYQRPIHNNDHNADATATAAALIPAVRAVNLFTTQPKLASPLSLALSYGFRSKRMAGTDYQGRVFSGTAFYHLYLMDNYRIDLTATTTVNDLNTLPAGTPKTQHAFTAAIYYEPSPNAPFNAVASFQNGSFGAVLTKVKQYFIGVAVSKINNYFAGSK
jgi:hypothetical protein